MGASKDGYSNFKFFEALAPQSFDGSASVTGTTVDRQGYETLTFLVHAGEISGIASALTSVHSCAFMRMQHGTSNAAGTVVWSNVSAEHMILDIKLTATSTSTGGYTSTSMGILAASNAGSGLANGTFFCLGGVSADKQSLWESQAYAVGYIGDRRWVRINVSVSAAGDTSAVGIAGIAVLGNPANWPVNIVRQTP